MTTQIAEADGACGFFFDKNSENGECRLRVTTKDGLRQEYRLDRWE